MVANLRYQRSWWYKIALLYSPTDSARQFLWELTPFLISNPFHRQRSSPEAMRVDYQDGGFLCSSIS